ncbi:hypothetical protein CGU36_27915, partial [Pseudomonas fluorescens]
MSTLRRFGLESDVIRHSPQFSIRADESGAPVHEQPATERAGFAALPCGVRRGDFSLCISRVCEGGHVRDAL